MFENKHTIWIVIRAGEINREVSINEKTSSQKRDLDHSDIKGSGKESHKRKLGRNNLRKFDNLKSRKRKKGKVTINMSLAAIFY